MVYEIGNIYFSVEKNLNNYLNQEFRFFAIEKLKWNFELSVLKKLYDFHGIECFPEIREQSIICRIGNDTLITDEKYSKCKIFWPIVASNNIENFLLQVFYSHAVQRHMLQFHSANSGLLRPVLRSKTAAMRS